MKILLDKVKKTFLFVGMKISRRLALQIQYFFRYKKFINFKSPRTFNDFLQSAKFNKDSINFSKYSDKFLVRSYVASKGYSGNLVELLFVGEKITEEVYQSLPKQFVLKANHTSGDVLIINDKKDFTLKELNKISKKWLKKNYSSLNGEMFYKSIDPKIMIEEKLTGPNGEVPFDYKFHCFQGKVKFVQVDTDRFSKHRRNFYDLNWNLLPFEILHRNSDHEISRPDRLAEMIIIAENLAEIFSYCRVDLYTTVEGVFFGEITFIHGSGLEPIYPISYEEKLGSYFDKGEKNGNDKKKNII